MEHRQIVWDFCRIILFSLEKMARIHPSLLLIGQFSETITDTSVDSTKGFLNLGNSVDLTALGDSGGRT